MSEMENAPLAAPEIQEQPIQPAEKMVPQSKVDEIVHRRHLAGYEKGKQEGLALAQQQAPAQQQMSAGIGGMQGLSEEKVREMIQRAQAEHANSMYAQNIANQFVNKVLSTKDKYADFNEVVDMSSLQEIPDVAELINEFDNTGDILYELKKHPHKMSSIITLLSRPGTIGDARRAVAMLSESIKTNQSASNARQPSDPLSQVKASTIGADNGERSITDLRNDPRYRR